MRFRYKNSILANNTNGDCGNSPLGNTTDLGYNIVEDGSCISSGTSMGGDPLLDRLQDNGGPTLTQALLPGSPAINAGSPGGCFGSDGLLSIRQRGYQRFGRCDIGAYEMQPIAFSTKSAVTDTVFLGDPITYSISLVNASTIRSAMFMFRIRCPSR